MKLLLLVNGAPAHATHTQTPNGCEPIVYVYLCKAIVGGWWIWRWRANSAHKQHWKRQLAQQNTTCLRAVQRNSQLYGHDIKSVFIISSEVSFFFLFVFHISHAAFRCLFAERSRKIGSVTGCRQPSVAVEWKFSYFIFIFWLPRICGGQSVLCSVINKFGFYAMHLSALCCRIFELSNEIAMTTMNDESR